MMRRKEAPTISGTWPPMASTSVISFLASCAQSISRASTTVCFSRVSSFQVSAFTRILATAVRHARHDTKT